MRYLIATLMALALTVSVRAETGVTDNQIKVTIVDTINSFFDIDLWEFGETFYFTELATEIHTALASDISTVVLVPTYSQNQFGDLFEVVAREDEIFQPNVSVSDIDIVETLSPQIIRQEPN